MRACTVQVAACRGPGAVSQPNSAHDKVQLGILVAMDSNLQVTTSTRGLLELFSFSMQSKNKKTKKQSRCWPTDMDDTSTALYSTVHGRIHAIAYPDMRRRGDRGQPVRRVLLFLHRC
jgi:hypothetical protein